MKVLVTGASGMLGGGVARALAARGDAVTVFQRRPSGVDGTTEIRGDIAEEAQVRAAVEGHDAVVHLAAKVSMVGAWDSFVHTNITGTRHIVQACESAGVRRLVFVSSPSVAHHGAALVGAGNEPADPARARGNYARSKAAAEILALQADTPDLAVVAIRPHIVWGPGDTQLVERIVARARAGRLALLDHGAALIDTTYVTNAVDAIVSALDRAEVAHGQALVVTNGEPRTVGELVSRICAAADVAAPRLRVPSRVAWLAGAVAELAWRRAAMEPPMTRFLAEQLSTAHWFDQRRTRDVLGWTPAIDLNTGFALLAESFRA